jgi:hypothetical protein
MSDLTSNVRRAIAEDLTVSYVEPGDGGEAVLIRVKVSEAIQKSKNYHKAMCAKRGVAFVDMSDEDYLAEYIVIHWAEIDFPEKSEEDA